MVRRKWRKFTLVVITTDDRLAATAAPGSVWDSTELPPQEPGVSLHGGGAMMPPGYA